METALLLIGEAAWRLGVSASRVRQLEREGVLVPLRTARGWRLYDAAAVERLAREREAARRVRT